MNKYIPFTSRDERLDDTFYIVSDGDIIVLKKTFLATNWAYVKYVGLTEKKVFLHLHHAATSYISVDCLNATKL